MQNRYRENLKKKDLHQAMKAKHAARMRIYCQNLTDKIKQGNIERHAGLQRVYCNKNKKFTYVLYYLVMFYGKFPHL